MRRTPTYFKVCVLCCAIAGFGLVDSAANAQEFLAASFLSATSASATSTSVASASSAENSVTFTSDNSTFETSTEPALVQPPSFSRVDWPVPAPTLDAFPTPQSTPSSDDEVTWSKLPKRFLHDQKEIWLFPISLGEGKHWLPTILTVGGTAGLIVADPHVEPHFRQTNNFHGFNRVFSSTVSGGLIAAVPIGFYAVALVRKNAYDQGTGLLVGESIVDDTILMVVMKSITRRARPSDVPIQGPYNDTFFNSPKNSPFGKGSSFPSGHAMMGFSVATIFAHRYRQHRWVPYVAYGLAGVISFARITTGAHFPSDVFIGAVTGFAIARYAVLPSVSDQVAIHF